MQTNSQIRQSSLAAMKGNWGSAVLVTLLLILIYAICGAGSADEDHITPQMIALVLLIFIYLPVEFGVLKMFLGFARGEESLSPSGLGGAFNGTYYWKAIGTSILVGIYTFLWTLLLIVPGIIKGLSYSMSLYIIAENPEMGAEAAIKRSMEMMRGYKMKFFLMQLGYIGWVILSAVTLFIGLLWIIPYYQTVFANFYLDVKADYEAARQQ